MAIHNSTAAQYSNNMRVTIDETTWHELQNNDTFNAKFYIQ